MTNGKSERLGKTSGSSHRLLALLVGLLAAVALIVSGAPSAAAQTRVGAQPQNPIFTVGAQRLAAPADGRDNVVTARDMTVTERHTFTEKGR